MRGAPEFRGAAFIWKEVFMRFNRNHGLCVFLVLACAALCFTPFNLTPGGAKQPEDNVFRQRARVVETDNSHVRVNLIIKTEEHLQHTAGRRRNSEHSGGQFRSCNSSALHGSGGRSAVPKITEPRTLSLDKRSQQQSGLAPAGCVRTPDFFRVRAQP